ncbi:MAG: hypothetical protein WAV46_00115 [Candidatus Moraniibacteriota bacterium]
MPHLEQMTSIENEKTRHVLESSGVRPPENIPEEEEDTIEESVQAQEEAEREVVVVLERIRQLPEKSTEENDKVDLDPGERLVEAKKVLEKVDFSVMQDIFSEMYRKSGLQSEPKLIPLENIEVVGYSGGESNSVEKRITIGADFSPWAIRSRQFHSREWRSEKQFTRGRLRADILSTFMHEQTHAISKNIRREEGKIERLKKQMKSFFFGRQKVDNSSGYQMEGIEKGGFNVRHLPFNEAVTDKIGEEVYDEYLKRTGEKKFFLDHAGTQYGEGYIGERAMVDIMIETLSASLDVPRDVVWDSIKQGYMLGVDLDESELSDAFDEIFTPEVRDKIAQWSPNGSGLPVEELNKLSKELVSSATGQEKVKAAYEKYQRQVEIYRESQKMN